MEQAETTKRRLSPINILITLLIIIQIGMGAAFYLVLKQKLSDPNGRTTTSDDSIFEEIQSQLETQDEDISAINDIIDELQDSISQIGSHEPEEYESASEAIDSINSRLDALEKPLTQAENFGPVTQKQIELISQMANEVRQLKQNIDSTGSSQWRAIQLLTSFDRLEERVLSFTPYTQAQQAFRIAAAHIPQSALWIKTLNQAQHDGISSADDLQERFIAAREAALNGDDSNNQETSSWDKIKQNISTLVRVRKTGASHSGDDVESIIARAEYALNQQEYEQLMQEIQTLPEASRSYFRELLKSVQLRENVLNTLNDIRSGISSQTEVQ